MQVHRPRNILEGYRKRWYSPTTNKTNEKKRKASKSPVFFVFHNLTGQLNTPPKKPKATTGKPSTWSQSSHLHEGVNEPQ